MQPSDQRKRKIARLDHDHFDLVVIGGGITGAGVALDAASRGLQVALIERNDFASGTSSNLPSLSTADCGTSRIWRSDWSAKSVRSGRSYTRLPPTWCDPRKCYCLWWRAVRWVS